MIGNRVGARLAGETAPIANVQQESDVVVAGVGLGGGEGFMSVRAYEFAGLELNEQQDAPDVVDNSVRVGLSVLPGAVELGAVDVALDQAVHHGVDEEFVLLLADAGLV